MPDRSVNIISQRYSKLCLLIYKAQGVKIDEQGNLETPPRFEKVDQLDEEAISKLKRASPPAILNVHRWSIEEDVTLLKAVPLLGNQWAELSTRLIPHRDRGHLRKRYQVLERRVKATVTRSKRGDVPALRAASTTTAAATAKSPGKSPRQQSPRQPRKRKPEQVKPMMSNAHASIIRGPMPAHLLCSTNAIGSKHPGAKFGRKSIDFVARRPLSREGESDRMNNGCYAHTSAHANGVGYANGNADCESHTYMTAHNSEFDASREASRFELILSETTKDWSQLSRMKRMMENDTESMVADTIVNTLANSSRDAAPPPQNGKDVELPNMEIEASSGLSMLHNGNNNARDDEAGQGPATPPKQQNGSILASVLERTRTGKEETKDAFPVQGNGRNMEASASMPLTPCGPPQRYPSSSFGTPLGVSPGPGLQLRGFFSPSMHTNGQSPGLKSWGSPGPLHSLMGGVDSHHDYAELCPLELTEASRQALEGNACVSGKPSGTSLPPTPSNTDLFHDTHGLKSTDFEAISALNSLSNSPAKFLKKRSASDMAKDANGGSATAKQSLFAAVVGGVEQKESNRKKRRKN